MSTEYFNGMFTGLLIFVLLYVLFLLIKTFVKELKQKKEKLLKRRIEAKEDKDYLKEQIESIFLSVNYLEEELENLISYIKCKKKK